MCARPRARGAETLIVSANSNKASGKQYSVASDEKEKRPRHVNIYFLKYNPAYQKPYARDKWLLFDQDLMETPLRSFDGFKEAADFFEEITGDEPPKPVWLDDA